MQPHPLSRQETTKRRCHGRQGQAGPNGVAVSGRQRAHRESAQRFDADNTAFICECSDPNCTERLHATLDEYEDVRADGATFMTTPGHVDQDIERVAADRGRFQVIEKIQRTVRATVKRLNPRTA
jgi:hypothetical protein